MEAVELGEVLVLDDEAAARRTILGAAVLERRVVVVRLGALVERVIGWKVREGISREICRFEMASHHVEHEEEG